MFVGTVTTASIAAAVWTQTVRTLSADPATDAGAAALVWGHAARTITADPATDAGAAALVWGHSTRTLTSSGLTGLVSAGTLISADNQSIAASATVDLRPAAGKLRETCVGVQAGGAGSCDIAMKGASQVFPLTTIAQSTKGGLQVSGNNTVGPVLRNNDATNAATYSHGGIDWS